MALNDKDSANVCLCPKEMGLPKAIKSNMAPAMNPNPPICIKTRMIMCPDLLQWDDVSSTTRPTVPAAEAAVKRLSIMFVEVLSALENGKLSNVVPSPIIARKPRIRATCGLIRFGRLKLLAISKAIDRPRVTETRRSDLNFCDVKAGVLWVRRIEHLLGIVLSRKAIHNPHDSSVF